MIPVFQTIVDKGYGDCMRAAVASLLELSLEEIPDFKNEESKEPRDWKKSTVIGYLHSIGLDACCINKRDDLNQGTDFLIKVAKFDGGYKGCFYASVPSQTFPNIFHAVVVDTDLNIVHDPNPNQRALSLKPEDVESIMVTKSMVIGKTRKLFTREGWENASEEERDANTHKH